MKVSVSTPTQTQNLTYMNWIPVKIQFMSTLLWDDDIKVSELNGCGVIVSLMLIITCWFVCECLCIALLLWWSQWFCLIRLFRLWVSLFINTVNLAVAAVVFVSISQNCGSFWCSFFCPCLKDKTDVVMKHNLIILNLFLLKRIIFYTHSDGCQRLMI